MNKSTILFLFASLQLFAQDRITSLDQIAYPSENPDWITFRPGVNMTSAELTGEYKWLFGMSENDELRLQKSDVDNLGMQHNRYFQYHHGYQVEGCEWVVHSSNAELTIANGKLMRSTQPAPDINLTEEDALEAALTFLPNNTTPLWRLTFKDTKRLKQGMSDPDDYLPDGKLLWAKLSASNDFEADQFRIAWRFKLYADNPASDRTIYIDATNGTLIRSVFPHPSCGFEIGQSQHNSLGRTAVNSLACGVDALTTYYGMVPDFGTIAINDTFHLIDPCDAGLGFVYTVDFSVTEVVEQETDDWTSPNDSIKSHITAHWAGKKARQYLDDVFSRNSFDDDGETIWILNDEPGSNAAWGNYMINGVNAISLGNSDTSDPDDDFGTVDVVGHELAHGVTEYSADLVYELEPGALNESFSDILGTGTEWHTAGITHDWLIAADRDAPPVRSMSNPNAYNDPDTYGGTHWYNLNGCTPDENNDHCGVHINSGVMNYWFYLLCQGGSGTNDNGDPYSVSGIGIGDAEQIAYRNLTVYLTSMSQYIDAREGSIQAAIDLFGCNSAELTAVINAWYAVGVGAEPVFDLSVNTFNAINYDAITSINVEATVWNVTSTVLESGYEITFAPNTDLTEDTDAVIIEDCDEVIPMQQEIPLPELSKTDDINISTLKHIKD